MDEKRTRQCSSDLNRILTFLESFFKNFVNPKQVQAYKNYLLYTMDRQVEIQEFQTNMKVPVVKQYVDTMFAAIYDNDIGFRVTARSEEDFNTSQDFKDYLDWVFSMSGSYNALMETIKEGLLVGNGYGKIGFHDDNREITYMKKGKKRKLKTQHEKYPEIRYVSCFNVFFDPTASSFEESQYVIERSIVHKKDILARYGVLGIEDLEGKITRAQENPVYFSTLDNNRVKLTAFWNEESFSEELRTSSDAFDVYYKNFLTLDYSGGFSEVLEYWEDDKFILIVDGHEIYSSCNPYPIKKKPFFNISYNKIPGVPFSHGIGTSLEGVQEQADTILNLAMDNMKMLVAPMFQKIRGGDTFGDGSSSLEYAPFKVHEVNSTDAFKRLELGISDFSGLSTLDYLTKMSEMSEGINSYGMGYQNKVERSAAGVTAMVESFKARLLPMMDSINGALTMVADFWMVLSLVNMEDDFSIRLLDKDGNATFKKISLETLLGRYDVEIDPRSLAASTKDIQKKQYLDMIQMAAQTGIDPSSGQFFVNMKGLWGGLLRAHDLDVDELLIDAKGMVKAGTEQLEVQAKLQEVQMELNPAPQLAPEGAPQADAGMLSPQEQQAQGIPQSQGEALQNMVPMSEQSSMNEVPDQSSIITEALQS